MSVTEPIHLYAASKTKSLRHTPGHLNCPPCELARTVKMDGKLDVAMKFPEAAEQWIQSRTFGNGEGRARYVAPGTIKSYREYIRALGRFFSDLTLGDIHVGHMRQYQLMRATGELGTAEDVMIARCAKHRKKTIEQLKEDPSLWSWTQSKIERSRVHVNPNKINQELTTLIMVLRRANAWTHEMAEQFEYLQNEEKDVPRAPTPKEQEHFLRVAGSRSEWRRVFLYATLAFRATATNCEMRNLRLGDNNVDSGIIMVQAKTAKNKYRIRTIPLPPDGHWALRELVKDANVLGSTQPQHHLFPFRVCRNHYDPTRAMSNSGIKRDWEDVRTAAELKWFRIHDLRHAAITRLAEAGSPIAVIMSMSGHIGARMIQHYTHISEQAQRMAVIAAYKGTIYDIPRHPVAAAEPRGYTGRHPAMGVS